ncbi:hypothetical protein BpHYR1_009938 [Brachionus plicatilis]|uniref:Uncharacterized protein n=1 Tax=Brachionus plicatilis TaxID=10195 RepID=A0A3M7RSV6_BRAPC|nr:hypothetical protein BpHYR1_009938 [Brachionus plicatilis]
MLKSDRINLSALTIKLQPSSQKYKTTLKAHFVFCCFLANLIDKTIKIKQTVLKPTPKTPKPKANFSLLYNLQTL